MINPKSKPHFTLEVNGVNVPVWVWDTGPDTTLDRITVVIGYVWSDKARLERSVYGMSETAAGFNQYLGEYGPKPVGDGYTYSRNWGKKLPLEQINPALLASIRERALQCIEPPYKPLNYKYNPKAVYTVR